MAGGLRAAALLVDDLTRAGVERGLPAVACRELVLSTMRGVAEQLLASGEHPRAYMEKVTSPGGTTAAGLRAMESGMFEVACAGVRRGIVVPASSEHGQAARLPTTDSEDHLNYTIANVIAQLFRIYNILIIIWCVLSWIPRGSGALDDFRGAIGMLVEPWLNIFRRFIPPLGGIDFSPIVAIFALEAIERLLLAILL